jgi:hypothetical protein
MKSMNPSCTCVLYTVLGHQIQIYNSNFLTLFDSSVDKGVQYLGVGFVVQFPSKTVLQKIKLDLNLVYNRCNNFCLETGFQPLHLHQPLGSPTSTNGSTLDRLPHQPRQLLLH